MLVARTSTLGQRRGGFCYGDLVHAADAAVEETVKRGVHPYFVGDGNICALLARNHVSVFL